MRVSVKSMPLCILCYVIGVPMAVYGFLIVFGSSMLFAYGVLMLCLWLFCGVP